MKKKHKRIVVALIVFVMVFSNLKLPGSYASEIEQENIEDNSARVNKVETDEPIDFEFFERLGIYHIRNSERISVRTPGTWQYFSNGKRKYIHNDGSFTTNGWELIDGYWYFFDPSGFMYTGFVEDGGHVYYLEENANASNY